MLSAVTSAAARTVWEQVWDYLSLTKHLRTNKNQSRLCLSYLQPAYESVCSVRARLVLDGVIKVQKKNGGRHQILAALPPSGPGNVWDWQLYTALLLPVTQMVPDLAYQMTIRFSERSEW